MTGGDVIVYFSPIIVLLNQRNLNTCSGLSGLFWVLCNACLFFCVGNYFCDLYISYSYWLSTWKGFWPHPSLLVVFNKIKYQQHDSSFRCSFCELRWALIHLLSVGRLIQRVCWTYETLQLWFVPYNKSSVYRDPAPAIYSNHGY